MDQCRAGHRSTQPQPEETFEDEDDLHSNPIPRSSTRLTVVTRLVPVDDIRDTDLTGRFPVPSATGSQYLMVMLCANYIHFDPIKLRATADFV